MLDAVISLVVFGERALFLFLFIRKKRHSWHDRQHRNVVKMIFKDLFKKRDEDGAAVYESENHPTDFIF